MIKEINPIILFVKNFNECLSFYRDILGLKLVGRTSENSNFATFDVGGTDFSIHGGYSGKSNGPIQIHFVTDDIYSDVERMKNNGTKFSEEIKEVPWGGLEATFVDPDGNEIDLYQLNKH